MGEAWETTSEPSWMCDLLLGTQIWNVGETIIKVTFDEGPIEGSKKMEQSYCSRIINWTQGLYMRIQDQFKSI